MTLRPGIDIKLLADCPYCVPELARLWFSEIGERWIPNANVEKAKQKYIEHMNSDELPLTFVAIDKHQPIGMASLRANDGIRDDLTPWLGSVIVKPDYRQQGIATALIEKVKQQAQDMGFDKLYLFMLDHALLNWYKKIGWQVIGHDQLFEHPVIVMKIDL